MEVEGGRSGFEPGLLLKWEIWRCGNLDDADDRVHGADDVAKPNIQNWALLTVPWSVEEASKMSFSLVNVFRNPKTQNYSQNCRALTKKRS